jgi:hypothetical protein
MSKNACDLKLGTVISGTVVESHRHLNQSYRRNESFSDMRQGRLTPLVLSHMVTSAVGYPSSAT